MTSLDTAQRVRLESAATQLGHIISSLHLCGGFVRDLHPAGAPVSSLDHVARISAERRISNAVNAANEALELVDIMRRPADADTAPLSPDATTTVTFTNPVAALAQGGDQ